MSFSKGSSRVWLGRVSAVIGVLWLIGCSAGSSPSPASTREVSLDESVGQILDAEVIQEQPPVAQERGQCVAEAQECRKVCVSQLPHQEMVEALKKCQDTYKVCVTATPDKRKGCRASLKVCLETNHSNQSTQMDNFRQCMHKCSGDFRACRHVGQCGAGEEGDNDDNDDNDDDDNDNDDDDEAGAAASAGD